MSAHPPVMRQLFCIGTTSGIMVQVIISLGSNTGGEQMFTCALEPNLIQGRVQTPLQANNVVDLLESAIIALEGSGFTIQQLGSDRQYSFIPQTVIDSICTQHSIQQNPNPC